MNAIRWESIRGGKFGFRRLRRQATSIKLNLSPLRNFGDAFARLYRFTFIAAKRFYRSSFHPLHRRTNSNKLQYPLLLLQPVKRDLVHRDSSSGNELLSWQNVTDRPSHHPERSLENRTRMNICTRVHVHTYWLESIGWNGPRGLPPAPLNPMTVQGSLFLAHAPCQMTRHEADMIRGEIPWHAIPLSCSSSRNARRGEERRNKKKRIRDKKAAYIKPWPGEVSNF